MKIDIVCAGKLKDGFYREACEEYLKRLKRYSKVNIFEVKDEPVPDRPTEGQRRAVLKAEAARMERYLSGADRIYALDIRGREFSSESFSSLIEQNMNNSTSRAAFVIGGSLGLAEEILKSADMRISFSQLTFPHRLMRVILLEQIYRSFKIIRNEPYHK